MWYTMKWLIALIVSLLCKLIWIQDRLPHIYIVDCMNELTEIKICRGILRCGVL